MYELLLAANAILWASLVVYFVFHPASSMFHPVGYYLFFHGFIFTFRPIVVHINEYSHIYRVYQFSPSMDDKITVLLASMLGLVCFVATALRTGNAPMRFAQNRFDDLHRNALVYPFLIVATVLVPLGLISIANHWFIRANDASTMVLDLNTGRYLNTTTTGYVADLQLVLAPLAVVCIWLFRFRWWSFLPLIAFIVLRGGTGGRWPIMMACATTALLFLYHERKRFPNIKAIGLLALALWLFQLVGSDRGASIRRLFIEDNSALGEGYNRRELGFLESMDWANLEFFEYLVYVIPQRSGTYGYFLDNLQILTEPIPRILWAGKPAGPPIQLFSLFDYGFPIGMTYSLPGNGWMQLGYVGVAIWCALFGWFYGKIYNNFQKSRQTNLQLIAYMLVLPLSLQFFRDGTVITIAKTHAWFLVPVLLIYFASRFTGNLSASDIQLLALRKRMKARPQGEANNPDGLPVRQRRPGRQSARLRKLPAK